VGKVMKDETVITERLARLVFFGCESLKLIREKH
jgi:hypothetical protein